MNAYKTVLIVCLMPLFSVAKDYKATLFGIKSDGKTMNTRSIQKGIDFISENGGGQLVFEVGRYLTGALQLKSNVTIKLEEGAVLVGSTSIYDYNSAVGIKSIISAKGQHNIGVSGKGVIEGQRKALLKNMDELKAKGFLKDSLLAQPAMIGFTDCRDIVVDSVIFIHATDVVQQYADCSNLSLSKITIRSHESAAGLILSNNKTVRLSNSFVEVSDNALQWKGDKAELKVEKAINQKGEPLTP